MPLEITTPTTKAELLEQLRIVDNYYRYRLDDYEDPIMNDIDLETVTFTPKTDEELLADAELLMQPAFEKEIAERIDSANEKVMLLTAEKAGLTEGFNTAIGEITDKYDLKRTALISEASKRGVSNSSTVLGKISVLDSEEVTEKALLSAEKAEKEATIAEKIEYYEDIADNAADFFEDKHTAEVQAKLYELKKEQDEKAYQILKYNNSVNEKMQRGNNTVKEMKAKMLVDYLNIVVKGLTDDELVDRGYYFDVISLVLNYYYGFDNPREAYEEFAAEARYITYLRTFYKQVEILLLRRTGEDEEDDS